MSRLRKRTLTGEGAVNADDALLVGKELRKRGRHQEVTSTYGLTIELKALMIRIHNLGELEMPRQVRQKARSLVNNSTLRVWGGSCNAPGNHCRRPPCCRSCRVVGVEGYRVVSVGNCRVVNVLVFSLFFRFDGHQRQHPLGERVSSWN